jgi:hypothetical protein
MPGRRFEPFTRIHAAALLLVVLVAFALAVEFDVLRRQIYSGSERTAIRWRPFGIRSRVPQFGGGGRGRPQRPFLQPVDDRPARRLIDEFYVFVASATIGASVLVLRPSRRARPRPLRDWGPAAVATSALVGTLLVAKDLLWVSLAWPPPYIPVSVFLDSAHRMSGIALGAWVTFALPGKRRARLHWRDRLGRLIGWCWLSYLVYLVTWPAICWFMLRFTIRPG